MPEWGAEDWARLQEQIERLNQAWVELEDYRSQRRYRQCDVVDIIDSRLTDT